MTAIRPPKKSETLEVRLPHAAKLAFMERCRAEGVTASDVVRRMIETGPARPRRLRGWQAAAAVMIGLTIGSVAAPSIAQALPGQRAAFDQLDVDRDGVLTRAEFDAR